MTIRAVVSGNLAGGERWVNVHHWSGTTLDAAEAEDIADKHAAFHTALKPIRTGTVDMDLVQLGLVGQGIEFEFEYTGVQGTASGTPMPNDCACVITWQTVSFTRRGRGRTYVAGLAATTNSQAVTGGAAMVSPSAAVAIKDACVALLTAPPLNVPVIYSRVSSSELPIDRGRVNRRWATQRRRDLETPELSETFSV